MGDEEIRRGILRVLGSSPTPLKAHVIASKVGGVKSQINKALYSMKHQEVEIANPGQNPPLWRLKVTHPANPAATNPGSQLPYQAEGVSPHQQGDVPPYPHQQGGMAPYINQQGGVAPYLHQQGDAALSSVSPHQPQSGAIPATQPLIIGGMASSPPSSLMGGVALPPPIEGMASSNSTPPSGQMYKRRDYQDGSLLFEPVDTPPPSIVPPHVRVMPGHMTSSPSHMTGGRDVMPGHVTCSAIKETCASSREQLPPQMDLDGSMSCNQQLQSPAPTRELPSEGGNFPGMSCSNAANLTGKVECMDPSNFANSAKKDFPAKDGAAKNFKVSSQLDCVVNNATPPPSSATPPSPSSSSSSSPSPSSSSAKSKKKKRPGIAAKFPPSSTANPAPNPNPCLSSTTTSPPNSAASQSPAVLPLLNSSMQSLEINPQSDIKEKVFHALKERELDSTELARLIGMEGRMEELMQSLMKLLEEGRAMKRTEQGKKYWKICDGKKRS